MKEIGSGAIEETGRKWYTERKGEMREEFL